MRVVWVAFVIIIALVRFGAGYDSRFQNGKYFVLKNKILRTILIDSTSFFEKNNRRKRDLDKISLCGLVLHIIGLITLILSLASFFLLPKTAVEPWIIDIDLFFMRVDSLNEVLSAGLILLYFMCVLIFFGVYMIKYVRRREAKWMKILTYIFVGITLVASVVGVFVFLREMILRI